MNKVCLSGNSVQELELKETKSGTKYVKFRIAVKRPFTKDVSDFFTLVIWGGTAEYLCRNVTKGTTVCASGYLTINEWETTNGEKRRDLEINCSECEVIFTSKTKDKQKAAESNAEAVAPEFDEDDVELDEDLPFLL